MRCSALLCLALCLLLNGCAGSSPTAAPVHGFAETGTITGRVTDVLERPVPFAVVVLQGTRLGARVDSTGYYTMSRVPVGTYTVFLKMVGYSSPGQVVPVLPGHLSTVNFTAEEVPVRGGPYFSGRVAPPVRH